MGEVGELLELMATAHKRYRTLQATMFERFERRLALELRHSPPGGFEIVSTLAVAAPGRLRIERRMDGELESLVVMDGDRANAYVPHWGTHVFDREDGDLRRALGAAADLVDPMPLLGALELTSVERGSRDGREVFYAQGRPRFALPATLQTCDAERLVVDAERGIVLQLVGTIHRKLARTLELRDVRLDVELPDETFVFPFTEDGEEYEEIDEEVSGLGLRDAAMLASFPLWALPRPVLDITYRGERSGRPESVTLEYSDVRVVLTSLRGGVGWTSYGPRRRVERGGRTYSVAEGSVWFASASTLVALAAPGAEDADLLDQAESLVPVET